MSNKTFDAFYNTLLQIFPTYKEFNSLANSIKDLTKIIEKQQKEINILKEFYKYDRDKSSKILQ